MTTAVRATPAAAQPAGRPPWRLPHRWEALALGASAAVGLFVFLWRLTTPSSVNDELIYRVAGRQYVDGTFLLNNEHPPLAKLLIGASEAVLGEGLLAARLPGAVLGFLTGLVVAGTAYLLVRSWASAVLAGALWWVLPIAPGIVHVHVARMAVLEGPLLFFLAAATLAAVAATATGRRSLWVTAGALAGLAACSKLTGVVAVAGLLPALVAQRGEPRRVAGSAAAAAVAFWVAFLLPYAPMGRDAWPVLRRAFELQLAHGQAGHAQLVAGTVYEHPPWWSPFWFAAQYLGWAALVALLLTAAVGVARHRRPEVVAVAAVVGAGVLLACTAPIKLPQYQDIWAPGLVVLAGISVAGLAGRRRSLLAVVLALALLPLGVAGARQVAGVAGESVQDYRAAGERLAGRLPPGERVVVWGDVSALGLVVGNDRVTDRLPPDSRPPALVTDETIVNRRPLLDVPGWVAAHGGGYRVLRFQRLTVYVRDDLPAG